ncbi:MAG: type II toxin-antitoxin system VapC family toxin [Candidatus Eremiobacterota bacterium]
MRVLLDTHIWLWFLAGDPRLGPRLRALIEDPGTGLWLSPISVWETLLLGQRKRISCPPDPVTWVGRALLALPVQEAPLTIGVVVRSRLVDLPQEDPADRFLVATALEMGLTLATIDRRLLDVPGLDTVG